MKLKFLKFWKVNDDKKGDRGRGLMTRGSAFDVEDIVKKVKIAVRNANVVGPSAKDVVVTGVTLNLKVVQEGNIGGEVKWKVPVIGLGVDASASSGRSATSTVEIKLVPPRPVAGLAQAAIPEIDLVRDLEQAITMIRSAIAAGAAGDPPFVLGTASVELIFGVKANGGISLLATADRSKETTNTLQLTLGSHTP